LLVGQDVWISAVDQGFIEGKVVEVTPEGADVQATGQGIIHFNREGYLPFRTIHDLPFWRIDSLPVAERRAMLERGRQKTMAVGQKVILSGTLPGGGTTGLVIDVTKWHVSVQVDARLEGKDGAYCVQFDYDGNVSLFYSWTDSKAGWDWAGSPCPIPDLKIVKLCY